MKTDGDNRLPETVGPYRIFKQLGEGGMAIVYLAEQNEPVRRRVALKILKPGMDSKQIVARFESERQALAVLDHPNIAKIFDGGIAENGRPYFAMEYVDGLPISAYCDQHELDNMARIQLFTDVCRAVQHAHLKGLIHRDLKPSNILVGEVDGKPQPRVIDFGIAKATDVSMHDAAPETRIGQVVGTPQYMSPEQTGPEGVDIDSRADIYSLGVVLYELLVGAPPLDLSAVRDIALPSVIREKLPPKPSTRFTSLGATCDEVAVARGTNAADLKRALRGDLDWIAMKAIEKDRDRRYETADALAQDCERYLNQMPVQARPPNSGYVLHRFVQRNRLLVIAASVAIFASLGGGIAAAVGYVRATEAEKTAQLEAATARQVSEFLMGLFYSSDPAEAMGAEITARELLEKAKIIIDDALKGEPALQARLKSTIGYVYRNLGLFAEAEALISEALETQLEVVGRSHPDTLASMNRLGSVYEELARYDDARALYVEALAGRQQVLGLDHADTLMSMNNLAVSYRIEGSYDKAKSLYVKTLAGQRRTLGDEHPDTLLTMNNLAEVYRLSARYREAESLFAEALAIQNRVLGKDHPATLRSSRNLATLYWNQGRHDEAEPLYVDLLERSRNVLGDDHSDTLLTKQHLANVYRRLGRNAQAETLYIEAIAGFVRAHGDSHQDTIAIKSNLAELYRQQGLYEKAEPIYLNALKVQTQLNPGHPNAGVFHHNLACLYRDTGELAESERRFEMARQVWAALYPPDHPYLVENYAQWAELKRRAGDDQGAAELEALISQPREWQ